MYEKLEQCPVCKSGIFKNFLICKDFSVSQESFAIVECKKCNFKFTNPRPSTENLDKYYASENYISHTNKSNNLINVAYKMARAFTVRKKISFIEDFHKKGNLLDVGCGTGVFLQQAKQKGWNVLGVEPNKTARQQMNTTLVPSVYDGIKDIKLKKHFHIITLWHVLEHLPDLTESIKNLRKLLHPEGKLVIAVPNCNSFDAKHYKEYWAAYDLPRHLYHFSPKTMKDFLSNHKLKLEGTYPMPLDAYYVSLLSEKYKNGENSYLKAIKTGRESNEWAKKNDNNYSSLIYVASLA